MDFHSLARRDLQALCKKNKIPANQTNLAMADALHALPTVEGLDEFLNQSEPSVESPEKAVEPSPAVPRTGRRKPIEENTQSSVALTRTRRTARKAEVPVTPAVPSSRKRAPVTRRKMETQFDEEAEEEKKASETPAVRTTTRRTAAVAASVTSRRSTRTLEKQLMGMDLNDKEEISMELDGKASEDVLVKTDDSEDLEKPEQTAEVIDASDEQKDEDVSDQKAVSDDVLVKTDDKEKEQIAEVNDASDEQKDESVDDEVLNDENKDEGLSKMEEVTDSYPIGSSDVIASHTFEGSPSLEVEISEKIGSAVELTSGTKNPTESVIVEEEPLVESYMVEGSDNKALSSEVKKHDVELTSLVDSKDSSDSEDDLTEPASEEDSEDEVMSYTAEISKSDVETDDEDAEMEDNVNSETFDFDTLVASPEVQEAEIAAPVKKTPLKASTPLKNSPFKAPTSSQKMIEILDENVVVPEKEEQPLEREVSKESSNSNVEVGNDISLRQLRKLFKTKLQISKEGKNIAEVGGKRQALQALPENCLTATEVERHNL